MATHGVPELPDQGVGEAETLKSLALSGYDRSFEIIDGSLRLDDRTIDPTALVVERTYRFEGASDPDYQSLVLALRHRHSDERGVLVTAYGPSASPGEADVLRRLDDDPHRSY